MTRRLWKAGPILFCILGIALPAGDVSANTTWAHEGWTKVGNLTLGGDVRVRFEYSENMSNMGTPGYVQLGPVQRPLGAWNDIDIWRERARLWFKGDLPKGITTYVRITQEVYWGGSTAQTGGGIFGNEDRWAMILDNAWLQIARPFDLPFTLKGGRMDQRYGECWLICDTDASYAGDGSRTFFFDGIKGTVHLDFMKTNVDLIYFKTHEQNFNEGNDDDDLYGLYATSTLADPVKIEMYLLDRDQRRPRLENVLWAAGVGINHPRRETQTWGARVSGKFGVFNFAAEGAGQTGVIDNIMEQWIGNTVQTPGTVTVNHYKYDEAGNLRQGSMNVLACAGYAHVGVNLADVPLKPDLLLGYWFYSGDDRTSTNWNGFDDLWGQAPLHGEYYLYSNLDLLSSPNSDWDPYMHTNIHFPRLQFTVTPIANVTFSGLYQAMFAHKNTQPDFMDPNSFTDSEGGHFRGHYAEWWLGYTFSENLVVGLRWEVFFPGNYYAANARTGQYGRVEFTGKF